MADSSEKGSVAHQIEMACVRHVLRTTFIGDCLDCFKGECTMNCSSASVPPDAADPDGVDLTSGHRLDGVLEPEAKDGASSLIEATAISIAISLKRIADAFATQQEPV